MSVRAKTKLVPAEDYYELSRELQELQVKYAALVKLHELTITERIAFQKLVIEKEPFVSECPF